MDFSWTGGNFSLSAWAWSSAVGCEWVLVEVGRQSGGGYMMANESARAVNVNIREVINLIAEIYPDWPTTQGEEDPVDQILKDIRGELLVLPFNQCIFETSKFLARVCFVPIEDGGQGLMVTPESIFGKTIYKPVAMVVPLDDDHVILDPIKIGAFDPLPVNSLGCLTPISLREMQHHPDRHLFTAITLYCAYSAWLMGWKREVEIVPDPVSRQQRRFLESSNKPVPVGRVRVKIETWKKQFRRLKAASTDAESKIPLHMVRGHRTIYNASLPMFNCEQCRGAGHKGGIFPHVGTFWTSPHIKGNKEHGIIEHDYSVSVN